MCFAWSVVYYISLCFLVYHNHPCCTHLLGEAHLIEMYQNTLCASLISFELNSFCSSTSFISFRARWCLNFEEIASLSCFTYIILRVSQNSMVFAMVMNLVLEWQAPKLGIIKTIIGSELDAMINLILDNYFEIWRQLVILESCQLGDCEFKECLC